MSGQTLRNRFKALLDRLALTRTTSVKQLDLASLRAGGATWLMHVSEDAELVRRRGRWLSHKIMEIYVQEVSAVLFMPTLPADVRQNLFSLMHSYPMIFRPLNGCRLQGCLRGCGSPFSSVVLAIARCEWERLGESGKRCRQAAARTVHHASIVQNVRVVSLELLTISSE